MTNIEKTVKRFLNSPKSLKYPELEKILLYLGFDLIPAKGSHKKFKHPSLKYDIIIPVHNNDCKKFYKIYASKIVKENIL